MMMLHSVIIGIILCVFMIFGLGQQNQVAERRSAVFLQTSGITTTPTYSFVKGHSILIASFVLIYMILFGHGLPVKLNKI